MQIADIPDMPFGDSGGIQQFYFVEAAQSAKIFLKFPGLREKSTTADFHSLRRLRIIPKSGIIIRGEEIDLSQYDRA